MGPARLRVILAHDDPQTHAALVRRLAADPEVHLCADAYSGPEALAALQAFAPALCILGVRLPTLDGFAVLRALPAAQRPAVVFLAHDERDALRAFEVQALDYLLLPLDEARFQAALARCKQQQRLQRLQQLTSDLQHLLAQEEPPHHRSQQRLVVRDGARVFLLPTAEIDWIEAADCYVQIHAAGQVYLQRESLQRLEALLDREAQSQSLIAPQRFVRIHRSALVNWDRVREVRAQGGLVEVLLRSGQVLPVSRRQRECIARECRSGSAPPA